MVHHTRGVEGSMGAPSGGVSGEAAPSIQARDNTRFARFWVSHRLGPFLCHKVGGGCEPGPNDNPGYSDDFERLLEQGFMLCPRCMRE